MEKPEHRMGLSTTLRYWSKRCFRRSRGRTLATFVLVHGSWHGGWCWRLVAPILRAKGHEVYTPTLTGLGASSHLIQFDVNLSTHIRDISNLLFYEDLSKVNLVGHSYAGMVITGVVGVSPERLSRLIYLDAIVPDPGESEFDYMSQEERSGNSGGRLGDSRDITIGVTRARPPGSVSYLGISDPKLGRWVSERLTNHPIATYEERLPQERNSSISIPRVYIHCTPKFTPYMTKAKSAGWTVKVLAAGHDAMLTAPQSLAKMLIELTTPRTSKRH